MPRRVDAAIGTRGRAKGKAVRRRPPWAPICPRFGRWRAVVSPARCGSAPPRPFSAPAPPTPRFCWSVSSRAIKKIARARPSSARPVVCCGRRSRRPDSAEARSTSTNAVKHFKWKATAGGGKRRIHDKPSRNEVLACRPWLLAEGSRRSGRRSSFVSAPPRRARCSVRSSASRSTEAQSCPPLSGPPFSPPFIPRRSFVRRTRRRVPASSMASFATFAAPASSSRGIDGRPTRAAGRPIRS